MHHSFRQTMQIAIAATLSLVPIAAFTTTAHAAADYTVTKTSDDGSSGTLRWAINQANASAGAETIAFSNSFTGTISLTSNLPDITDDVTITGPGESNLTIDGTGSYRPITITTSGATLTMSHMTLSHGTGVGFGPNEGSLIFNDGATINASYITVKNDTGVAAFNLHGGTVSTYTNCTFKDNNIGISSDHGNTPDAVSNTESDYGNRTYIVNSTFLRNSTAIYAERFTKITGSTFTDNGTAAQIFGLNRSQILNSTFTGSTFAIYHRNWTPVQWTNVGTNNRYINNNTFIDNDYTMVMFDAWNDGNYSQKWTTITNNMWDGTGSWIYAGTNDGSNNSEVNVTTVNSSGREWHESGNTIGLPTTTTTSTIPPATTTIPQVTTTTPNGASNTSTTVASSGGSVGVSGGSSGTQTTVARDSNSTGVTPTTPIDSQSTSTSSTIPAPDAPQVSPGEGGATVDGESVEATVTRSNNALVVAAAGIEANIYGVTADGDRIGLDSDGNLRLTEDSKIGVQASGFEPGANIEVWMFSTPTRVGTVTADATGLILGSFKLPAGIEAGDHRVVLKGANNKGQDVVLGVGVAYGKVDSGSTWTRLLIAIPVSLAVIFGLIIPTTLKRRREHENA